MPANKVDLERRVLEALEFYALNGNDGGQCAREIIAALSQPSQVGKEEQVCETVPVQQSGQRTAEQGARADDPTLRVGAGSPLSSPPAPAAEPAISTDGPHEISKTRKWLARQLLDSMLSEKEALGVVAYSPALEGVRPPPEPVAISREDIEAALEAKIAEVGGAFLSTAEIVDALSKLSGYPLVEGKQGVMASSAGVCGEGTLPSPSEPPRSAGGEV